MATIRYHVLLLQSSHIPTSPKRTPRTFISVCGATAPHPSIQTIHNSTFVFFIPCRVSVCQTLWELLDMRFPSLYRCASV